MLNDLDCIEFVKILVYSASAHATRLDFVTRVHYRLDDQESIDSFFVSAPHLLSTLPSDVRIRSFKLALMKYVSFFVCITLVGSVILSYLILLSFLCTHKLVFYLFQESMLDT